MDIFHGLLSMRIIQVGENHDEDVSRHTSACSKSRCPVWPADYLPPQFLALGEGWSSF